MPEMAGLVIFVQMTKKSNHSIALNAIDKKYVVEISKRLTHAFCEPTAQVGAEYGGMILRMQKFFKLFAHLWFRRIHRLSGPVSIWDFRSSVHQNSTVSHPT